MNCIKTWKERKGLLNTEPFRAFIGVEWEMQAEIDELRAVLAQPGKPVRIVEEQPPSGTLTNPEVARSALKAVFSDIPDYFKTAKEWT